MKKPLIVIAGPTASGKTEMAVNLAKLINGEIISADSMQVYKYMNIGTAKPTIEEMNGVKHYLIDELFPDDEFNVMIFQKKAKEYMNEIYAKGKIPIIAGGTGFYINALVYDNNFMETDVDLSIRESLHKIAEAEGVEKLHEMLMEVDPEYGSLIHANNVKRVARAIEYFKQTGEKLSEHNKNAKAKESPYNTAFIILNMEREMLYERINMRVDKMMEEGLLDEVKNLLELGYSPDLVSMQGLGYKEFMPYINGEIILSQAVDDLKKSTRHFAKRQLTWFNGQTEGIWLNLSDISRETAVRNIIEYLKDFKIID